MLLAHGIDYGGQAGRLASSFDWLHLTMYVMLRSKVSVSPRISNMSPAVGLDQDESPTGSSRTFDRSRFRSCFSTTMALQVAILIRLRHKIIVLAKELSKHLSM